MRALEDLRTQVRSPRSRKYVDEAIAAYGAGAYRSSIIAIWIAVVSDLIDKIRLLADDGEAAAITMRQVLDNAISNADKTAMQKFEFSVLEAAKSSLHIIGEQECVDLERLRDDRHLCAHPAYM